MFITAVKVMLIVVMLAGAVALFFGGKEIWRTLGFVQASTGRSKAVFVGYHRESTTTSIRSYSPANPNMISTTQSRTVATYPEFRFKNENGMEQLVRESKVHVFSCYKPGDTVDILLSSPGFPRMASFYSLYFRDIVIVAMGVIALTLALVFWNFALPHFKSPPPVSVFSQDSANTSDTAEVLDSTESMDEYFNNSINEALNFKVGPIRMKHILLGFAGLFVLVIILSIFKR